MTTAFQEETFQNNAFQIDSGSANAGYRAYEAIWLGGASAATPVFSAGYRSYEALWLGGAHGYEAITPPTPPTGNHRGGGTVINIHHRTDLRKRKRKREDEEILFL